MIALAWPPRAAAQDAVPSKASCAEAYESAQESRASGHLQETERRLTFCARAECPSFVQKDCARWLGEVQQELPSVIVSAVAPPGESAAGVSVKIDGRDVPDALGGHALSLDPGKHELVLERPGKEPVIRTILAQQGVQNRAIEVPLQPPPAAAQSSLEADHPQLAAGSPLRPYAYVAWGVGAIGLGTFAVFGTLGRADEKGLEQDCPKLALEAAAVDVAHGVCAQSSFRQRRSSYKHELATADIGLVTGLIGAAAGTVIFFVSASHASADTAQRAKPGALAWDVSPTPGGVFASVHGAL